MVHIQVYCVCGYSVRLTGSSLDEDLSHEGFDCPLCARDLLFGGALLQSHPALKRLDGRSALSASFDGDGPLPELN
jgi:hypothetical protein